MGWNGSDFRKSVADGVLSAQKPVRRKRHAFQLTLGICVALGIVAIFCFILTKDDKEITVCERQSSEPYVSNPISQIGASKSRLKKTSPQLNKPIDNPKPYPPQAYWPDGTLKEHSRWVKVITNAVRKSKAFLDVAFQNQSDRDIGYLLTYDPGKPLFGNIKYDQRFVRRFLQSLNSPIVITDEDSPRQREVKKAVLEARNDLKARYDSGEDIAEIMNSARRELKELALYRQEIDKQIRTIRKEKNGEFTKEDCEALIDAANQMLIDRGCSPIKDKKLIIEQFKIREPVNDEH